MNKKSFISLLLVGGLIGCGLAATQLKPINVKQTKADAGPVTVVSSFASDTQNLTVGTLSGDIRYLVDSQEKCLDDVALNMFRNSVDDNNVNFVFNGNEANYPRGNLLRNKYDGYLQLRYPETKDHDGGEIVISPASSDVKITSVTVTLHSRNYTGEGSGNAYCHVTLNGVEETKSIAELGYTSSNLSKTWSETNGINSFSCAITLAHDSVGSNEKYLILGSVSATYMMVGDYHLVEFDTDGGTEVSSQIVATNGYATRPATDPTKESTGSADYEFDDWYTTSEGNTKFNFSNPITAATTVYAHWIEHPIDHHTLTFETNGGDPIEPQVVAAGGKTTKPSTPTKVDSVDPTRYAYKFKDWYSDAALSTKFTFGKELTEDTTIYARWERNAYVPAGASNYNVKNGIHDNNNKGWGDGAQYSSFAARHIISKNTFSSSLPVVNLDITSNGGTYSGMRRNNWEFVLNDTVMTLTVKDHSKYMTSVRVEALTQDYKESRAVDVTITSGEQTYETRKSPWIADDHEVWIADFDPADKITTFDFNVPDINHKGIGLCNLVIEYASFTTEEAAINYATDFNDSQVCGATSTSGLDEGKWEEQGIFFEALPSEVKSYLATYDGENAEIVEMLERYDRVIFLHGAEFDFMGRIASANIPYKADAFTKTVSSDNSLIICVVVGVLVLSTSALLILKKKKQK